MLFGQDDLAIARNQPQYHYFEWLAAIELWKRWGLLSLVEKYQFKGHVSAHAIFSSIVPESVREILSGVKGRPHTQGPDLFVYDSSRSNWFFCEVKGPRDRLRPSQQALFDQLERASGKPIRLVRFTIRGNRDANA
jgi:hypothetical protein